MVFLVIMAGGVGTRFWPRSRRKTPKQLLNIVGNETMLQSVVARLGNIATADNLYVVSTLNQEEGILEQLPFLKPQNLIIEPKGKNTAPCIGLSSILLEQKDPDAVMVILPSDHIIRDYESFRKILRGAIEIAEKTDHLITIGIEPTYPATAYGYIQYDGEIEQPFSVPAYNVKTFAEKPDIETAELFIKSGDFLWNSGIFIWKISVILKAIKESLPELYYDLMEIKGAFGSPKEDETIRKVYRQIKGISIDYGVMEHAKNVIVLRGNFGWNDIGSWEEVYKISEKNKEGNVLRGNHVLRDVKGCLIDSPDKMVAAIGVQNLIIVDAGDALLVCPRDQAEKIKDIVEIMNRKDMDKYL